MTTCLAQVQKFYPDVTTVVDGTRAIKVVVQQLDLKGAKKKAPDDCAMARACIRTYALDGAVVRPSVAYLVRGKLATRYRVPPAVYTEIVSFDRHGDFRPGEYHLNKVGVQHQIGAHQGSKWKRKPPKRKLGASRVYHRTLGIR